MPGAPQLAFQGTRSPLTCVPMWPIVRPLEIMIITYFNVFMFREFSSLRPSLLHYLSLTHQGGSTCVTCWH
jgi:hypothetical protein